MKISEKIKIQRKSIGLTQEQVANYLGVSTPAVNKWEKGNTYPDITLLPALARLLQIDMNELFSFRDELSEYEVIQIINEMSELSLSENFDKAFEMATEKMREYPRCETLIYYSATILNAGLALAVLEDNQKSKYEKQILVWLENAANSQDEKIKMSAKHLLASKYVQLKEFDKAEILLSEIPDLNVDNTLLQVVVLTHQEDEDTAAVFLEGKIIQILVMLQSYLYKLIELEESTGNLDKARQIVEIADRMVSLFGLWNYGAVVPHLLISVYKKDVDSSVSLIKKILEEAVKPWNIEGSPLYYRYPKKELTEGFGKNYIRALISEIEHQDGYSFLKDNEELSNILDKYRE